MARSTNVILAVLGLLGAAACEEDTIVDATTTTGGGGMGGTMEVPCDEDPYSCPMGTTCWTVSNGFDCVPSGMGTSGSDCVHTIGEATCRDGLICIPYPGMMNGECMPFCDAMFTCPNNGMCQKHQFVTGGEIDACTPSSPSG